MRMLAFVFYGLFTPYPHFAFAFLFLCYPLGLADRNQLIAYYAISTTALIATYPLRRRVAPFYSRHERLCNIAGLIAGFATMLCLKAVGEIAQLAVVSAYFFCFGCLYWVITDEILGKTEIAGSAESGKANGPARRGS